ncbi:MAG TPA: N-6 DNA methylase [Geobacterales bacterium]|nr:N-6 DNA methylase [Geobacterales bacterium]
MTIPKATENTLTSILTNAISKLGINAQSFYEISTPNGNRIPDIYCSNGGSYVVEAKFTEKTLIDAISKIQNDYLKHSKLLSIDGGFAVLYPDKLSEPMPPEVLEANLPKYNFKLISMFRESDDRPFSIQTVNFDEIASVIAEHVKHKKVTAEPLIHDIVTTLRDGALYLVNGLAHLAGSELIAFFGGENVFKNILEHKEDSHTVEEMRLAASYLLINQLLFYRAISTIKKGFDEIDPDNLSSPSDLLSYFKHVTDINYKVVFSYQVAPLIPPKFLSQVKTIVGVINGIKPEKVGGELLGMIFHDLIPLELRKKVAAWYTNVAAARLLANILISDEKQRVADFACGSGGLLVAAYNRKKELTKNFSFKDHKEFIEKQLLGIDVMPFAANVAACNLSLQSPQYFTDRINMAVWDSTDLEVGKIIPSVSNIETNFIGQ